MILLKFFKEILRRIFVSNDDIIVEFIPISYEKFTRLDIFCESYEKLT